MSSLASGPAASLDMREVRGRQVTSTALAACLVVSTLAISDERALFSPLGDVPVLGDLSPTAYAMLVSGVPSRGGAPRGAGGGYGGSVPSPVAFGANVPGGSGAPGGGSPLAPDGAPAQLASTPSGVPGGGSGSGVGGGSPGFGGGGGGTGGGGGGSNGPQLPDPTGAVPEPATWLTMILGFGVIGAALRRRRRSAIGSRRAEAAVSAG